MNVLFLLKWFEMGGVEMVTLHLAKKFVEEGHNVYIVSFERCNNSIESFFDSRIKRYRLNSMSCSNENISLMHAIMVDNKINIVINQWGLPYQPIRVARKAAKKLNVKFISVYHNTPDNNGRLQACNLQLEQTSNLIMRLGCIIKKSVYRIATAISMRYVYKKSDNFILLSSSFIEKFEDYTRIRPASKLLVLTNPITVDSSDFKYSLRNKRKEIIFVGRVDENQKRISRVIDTWKLLENLYSDWSLTIVGDGSERVKEEKRIKELGLKHIHFVGFQKPIEYYKRASILILTSEFEGFPLVLAECMSFGVIPVVYGSYSAVYDIIVDGYNGLIYPKHDGFNPYLMAEKIKSILQNERKRDEMAMNAIETSKMYSLESVYLSWNKILNNLLYGK